jgi:WS/DGAT/MGAT family acyltransferase
VGLIQKTHHALIDGISGIDVATVLLDFEPDPDPVEAPEWEPQPAPSNATLLLESLTEMVTGPTEVLRSATQAVRRPDQAAESVIERTVEAGRTLVNAATPAPPTPWNEPVGPERRFEVARVPLDRAKRIKDAVGASVNDVVLATCTGALRSFLEHRDEEVDGLVLQALVPVSVRSEDEHLALGNRVSGLLAELPVGEKDPKQRLLDIAAHMSSMKESGQAEAADRLLALTGFAPPTIVGLAARLLVRQRTVNLGITNVPGPQQPLYCMGARMIEAFPYVGVFESMGLLIGLISYDGQLGFGLTGDRRHLADLDILARAIEEESEVLERAVSDG